MTSQDKRTSEHKQPRQAAAHALRLLEKVRAAAETRRHPQGSREAGQGAPHAVVIGGGLAGLVAARDLRQSGHRVTVLEASDRFGGCISRAEIDGLPLDSGAESFAVRGGTVANYLREMDLQDRIAPTSGATAWLVQGKDGAVRAHPLPATAMLGIPAHLRGEGLRELIGRAAAVRAATDLVTPIPRNWATKPLTVAEVVRQRMGSAVLEQLVTPVVAGVYSTDPSELDLDLAAPDLRRAMLETGSLAKAVAQLQQDAPAGSRVAGIEGGIYSLIESLVDHLQQAGALLVPNATVDRIEYREDQPLPFAVSVHGEPVAADRVVLAVETQPALELLEGLGRELPGADEQRSNAIALAILLVDKPELDDAPRGSGALVNESAPVRAKALTHATAKWPWLAEQTGPGTHVVRLSYGRIGQPDELVATGSDGQLIEQAVKDASKILGVELTEDDVLGSHVQRFSDVVPLQGPAAAERRAVVAQIEKDYPGLAVTGAWVAGTGLARVIAHARSAVALSVS